MEKETLVTLILILGALLLVGFALIKLRGLLV